LAFAAARAALYTKARCALALRNGGTRHCGSVRCGVFVRVFEKQRTETNQKYSKSNVRNVKVIRRQEHALPLKRQANTVVDGTTQRSSSRLARARTAELSTYVSVRSIEVTQVRIRAAGRVNVRLRPDGRSLQPRLALGLAQERPAPQLLLRSGLVLLLPERQELRVEGRNLLLEGRDVGLEVLELKGSVGERPNHSNF
jgi:hypothetical protein